MKIKIHSSELNRMLKTVVQCIDTKIQTKNSNINIIHDNNLLAIRATNGTFSAVMTAPLMGGTGESFYFSLFTSHFSLLFYPSFVQRLGVSGSVLQMFLIGLGEIVGAREILLGTHVDIVVVCTVEHGIDALN